jgi:glutaminyl-peptide cyclotransferase
VRLLDGDYLEFRVSDMYGRRSLLVTRMIAARVLLCLGAGLFSLTGGKARSDEVHGATDAAPTNAATTAAGAASKSTPAGQGGIEDAPDPAKVDGFDARQAFQHVAAQVALGPRPSGSQALAQAQDYILSQLNSFGCTTDIDVFNADTPVGRLPMKNILVKIPGNQRGVIMLGTHYDTLLRNDFTFVGADDGGSSTGVMLELARILCAQHGKYAVWIAFFDGEEAMKAWSDSDSRYGSRQMAARFAASGDNARIRAFMLADLVGSRELHFLRDPSTPWLTDLVWKTAARLGYSNVFLNDSAAMQDDHNSFASRKVPVVDVIDLNSTTDVPFWHTADDTMDHISARSLAITGHVFLESIKQLQKQ